MKTLISWLMMALVLLPAAASVDSVRAAESYAVEVDCDYDDDDHVTECEFSGITPDGASDILRVIVPLDLICTDVIDGDFERLDAGNGTPGYASEEDEDEFELELRGYVTTTGTATYQVATVGRVHPAEGPGLRCDDGQGDEREPRPTATATAPGPGAGATTVTLTPPSPAESPTTGTLVVETLACGDVPADRSGFDWFGECTPGAGPLGFNIDNVHDTGMGERAVGTDGGTGEAVFEDVPPGTFRLTSGPGEPTWCHAKSDSVNGEGHVVIRAGETATVWAFYCEDMNA